MKDMVEIQRMTLHNPLFVAGTNMGNKLDITARTGLKMVFDRNLDVFHVYYKQDFETIERSNVAQWRAVDPKQLGLIFDIAPTKKLNQFVTSAQVANIQDAQVEHPHHGKLRK